jgi:serine phosphatase RsbU (regulator of sigma subunit)
MKKEFAIILILLYFLSLTDLVTGQDTLIVSAELVQQREADSLRAYSYFEKAQRFNLISQGDSSLVYITKSLEIAREKSLVNIEAADYELLASVYENQEDWEETLRNYLRAYESYRKIGDKEDEARILRILAWNYFRFGVYIKSAQYSEQEFLLYGEQDPAFLASSSELAARSYFYLPVDSLSTRWYNAASVYYTKLEDTTGLLRCTDKLGTLYIRQEMYDRAFEEYSKILSYYQARNDFKNIATIFNQIGFLKFRKKDINSAIENFRKAVEYSEKGGSDDFFLTDAWSNIAICQQNFGNQVEMLRCFEKALQYAKNSGRTDEVARINRILAMIYFNKGDNYHAEMYCLSCIEAANASGNLDVLQLCYKDYSGVLEKGNDFVKALEYYEKHLNLRDSLNYANRIREQQEEANLAEYEAIEQRIRNEIATEEIRGLEMKSLRAESQRRENEIKLLVNERELERLETDRLAQSLMLEKERSERRQREQEVRALQQQQAIDSLLMERKDRDSIALAQTNQLLEADKLQKETELKNERLARQLAVGIGSLMLLVAFVILLSLLSTRKKNRLLAEQKKEIEKINSDLEVKNTEILKQKEIIEQKNQSITDSIQYASRIQAAVLPPINFLNEWGIDNFILYKPKAIVSGDFYWGVKKENRIIIAAGDCTGHGVPGAFMSMLGHAFLEEIVNTREIGDAAMILNLLRDEVINTLKQKGLTGEARDGMDISLCIIDRKTGKLDYAGANNPLYLIRDSKLTKYEADRMPIGIHFISFTPFTNRSIKIEKGDYLYLFSDGYADQFGGPRGKKFMYKPFQDLLQKNHNKPMEIQKEILDTTFEKWKGDRDQVDDVIVIGMRI